MKKILFLLVLLVFSASVFSITTKNINLGYKESILIAGRNITLSSVSYERLVIYIDGNSYVYSVNEIEENDGVGIGVGLIYEANKYRNLSVDLNVTVYYFCGDGKCDSGNGESSFGCCLDCNCSGSYSCFRNKCVKSDMLKCISDSECDDDNSCTMDLCGGSPVIECSSTPIKECSNNDGCCPESCSYSEDNDCQPEIIDDTQDNQEQKAESADNVSLEINITAEENIKLCRNNSDCDDNDASTVDKCDKFGKVCYYISAEEANMITGAAVTEQEWNSEKKDKNFFLKFFEWLLGLI